MLSVVCWKWGSLFSARYVNTLKRALAKYLHVEHQLVCVTEDPTGIDSDVRLAWITRKQLESIDWFSGPRCRRRMKQYDREFAVSIGATRILSLDLDVVIVDDITPLVDRPEPIVLWRVQHAGAYSGSFVLYDAGALHGMWERFRDDPEGYPKLAQRKGVASDQAMLNHWIAAQPPIAHWTERDGFVSYFGAGYERVEYLGLGPHRQVLPRGARIVVLGSADKAVMDEGAYPWIREHWTTLTHEIER
jgi:hypothetical protein